MLQCSVCCLSVCQWRARGGHGQGGQAPTLKKIRVGQDIKTSARLSTLSWLTSGLPNSTAASTSLSLACGMNKPLVIERVLTGTVQPDDIVSSWFYNHLVFITSSNHWFDSWSRSVICLTATKPTVWCYKQAIGLHDVQQKKLQDVYYSKTCKNLFGPNTRGRSACCVSWKRGFNAQQAAVSVESRAHSCGIFCKTMDGVIEDFVRMIVYWCYRFPVVI